MPGMVVSTQTERLKQVRKGVMELYISDHPLDCLTCAANGDCELQDMAGGGGLPGGCHRYSGRKPPQPRQEEFHPHFSFQPSPNTLRPGRLPRLRAGAGNLSPAPP